jgi:rhamnulokinase
MEPSKRILAFDFGASSGRAMKATFDGEKIKMEEIHRFSNDPVLVNGVLYWDILRLFHEIKQGMLKCSQRGGFDSVGIDTWGNDFGLLGRNGILLENPIHYRDLRTAGMMEYAFLKVSKDEIYKQTGVQFMEVNTIYQVLSIVKNRPELAESANNLISIPDLFNYFLTGNIRSEYSWASTTQLFNPTTGEWATNLMDKLGIPKRLFTKIVDPGCSAGLLSDSICEELSIPKAEVISVASHDTASAVVSVPAAGKNFVYISSGTWSLMGIEADKPIISEKSATYNFTNECGYNRTIRFLKNIMGLWIIQESRRKWQGEGENVSFAELEAEARVCKPFRSLIDPDAPELLAPGDMPARIRQLCRKTGEPVPDTRGEIVRCIYESLALKYRLVFNRLKEITGNSYNLIHIVGGGAKDEHLNQSTADATGCEVIAGPTEATVLGNIAVQLICSGEIGTISEARDVIAASFELKRFFPQTTGAWDEVFERFTKIVGRCSEI